MPRLASLSSQALTNVSIIDTGYEFDFNLQDISNPTQVDIGNLAGVFTDTDGFAFSLDWSALYKAIGSNTNRTRWSMITPGYPATATGNPLSGTIGKFNVSESPVTLLTPNEEKLIYGYEENDSGDPAFGNLCIGEEIFNTPGDPSAGFVDGGFFDTGINLTNQRVTDLAWGNSGNKIFMLVNRPFNNSMEVYSWDLNIAYDITAIDPTSQASYDLHNDFPSFPRDNMDSFSFNAIGTKMYMFYGWRYFGEWTMSTPWDVTTLAYTTGSEYDIEPETGLSLNYNNRSGFVVNEVMGKIYVIGESNITNNIEMWQYDTR